MLASEADDIRLSNAKILNPAEVSLTKAGRMKSVYVVFSIVLGITLGIGFGFLLENFDHSVKSAADAEELAGAPLLGSIPETRSGTDIRNRMGGSFSRKPQ
jgi:capsular polysaccharide biosynthesis protein